MATDVSLDAGGQVSWVWWLCVNHAQLFDEDFGELVTVSCRYVTRCAHAMAGVPNHDADMDADGDSPQQI